MAINRVGMEFRAELERIMPGYKWTVHSASKTSVVQAATGTQSSGSNRLSTLAVERREMHGEITYTTKSAGYGRRAKWLHTNTDRTLARAVRGLQEHYKRVANTYRMHEADLVKGRQGDSHAD